MTGFKARKRSFKGRLFNSFSLSLALFLCSGSIYATQWLVNSTGDTNTSGTLRYAIANAVSGDTINFSLADNSTITLTAHLPVIMQSSLTIDNTAQGGATGAKNLTIDGANSYMIFFVYNGASGVNVTGSNGGMTLTRGLSEGGNGGSCAAGGGGALGAGGALFVNNTTTAVITDVYFAANTAQGGNGGVPISGTQGGAGGGGMLGGNGGDGTTVADNAGAPGGGGGGGLGANGGQVGHAGAFNAGGNGGNGATGLLTGAGAGGTGGTNSAAGTSGVGGGGGGGGAYTGNSSAGFTGTGGNGGANGGGGGGGAGGSLGHAFPSSGGGGGLVGGGGGGGSGAGSGIPGAGGDFGGGGGGGPGGVGGFGGGGGNSVGGFGGGGGGGPAAGGFAGGAGGSMAGGGGGGALGGAIFVRQGGTLTIQNSSQNPTISGNTVTSGASGGSGATAGSAYGSGIFLQGSNTLTFSPVAAQTITFSDVLGDEAGNGGSASNKAALTMNGAGTLVLSNANKYAGTTTLTSGTLAANNNAALGTSTLAFNGGTLQQTAGGTIALSNPITISAANGTIGGSNNLTLSGNATLTGNQIITNTGTTTLSGILSSTGGVTVNNGSGTAILSNANTYAGTTTLTSGTLTVNSNSSGTNHALGTSTLAFNGGTLQQGASGGLTLPNSFTVSSNNGIVAGSNNITLSGNGILTGNQIITNTGTTTLSGLLSSTGGVTVNNGTGTVILSNANTYTGTTTLTSGTLTVNSNSSGTNHALGTGTLAFNGGTLQQGTSAGLTLPNSFTVSSNNGTVAGSNNLTLSGNGTLTGNKIITNSAVTTLTGALSGTGSVTVNSGAGNAILSGNNTYTGATTVTSGRLSVNGSITSPVTVAAAGTLGGTGTITGNVVSNGLVSPGNSIGTLIINGNYSPSGSSSTHIEINPQGQCSVLNVSGTANLNGFLNIAADPGTYSPNVIYQFLTASTINGDFSGFTPMIGPYRVGVAPAGDSSGIFEISFTINPISPQLSSAPATASTLAGYLDSLPTPAVGSDLGDNVIGPISNLLSGTALNQALTSISPARMTTTAPITQSTSTLVNGIIGARLSYLRNNTASMSSPSFQSKSWHNPLGYSNLVTGKPSITQLKDFALTESGLIAQAADSIQPLMEWQDHTGLWIYGFGNREWLADTATMTGFEAKTGGYSLGIDHRFTDLILGAGLGKAVSLVHLNEDSGSNRLDNTFINLYGSYSPQGWYLDASLTAGRVRYETNQVISFLTLNRTAVGKHYGFQFTPHLGAGYEFKLPLASLIPFINLDYSIVSEGSYKTIGADSLNQNISSTRSALLRKEYGIKISKKRRFCHCRLRGIFTSSLSLSRINKKITKQGNISMGFAGQPGSFSVEGYHQNSKQLAPGLGLAFNYDNGGFISTNLQSEIGQGYRNYEATLKVGLVF